MTESLLQVEGISKTFGGVRAVQDVSLTVEEGQVIAIIGPNGAGKTTLFNIISGMMAPDSGIMRFAGRRLDRLPMHAIAACGIARTFQDNQLFHLMTALENVMMGRYRHERAGILASLFGLARREEMETRQMAERMLARVGLADRAHFAAADLPLGEQRLLELARALAAEPRLLLLDEPTAGLNGVETVRLAATLRRIRAGRVAILLVEHDMNLVMSVADWVVVLNHGETLAQGAPEVVQRMPEVIEAYLGEVESR